MANKRFSDLPAAAAADGTENFVIVHGGNDELISMNHVKSYILLGSYLFPKVVSGGRTAGLTTAITTLAGFAYTSPATSTYQVSSYLNVLATSGGDLYMYLNFKDENGVSQSIALSDAFATGFRANSVVTIRVQAGSVIDISTTFTGTATYDLGATLIQLD